MEPELLVPKDEKITSPKVELVTVGADYGPDPEPILEDDSIVEKLMKKGLFEKVLHNLSLEEVLPLRLTSKFIEARIRTYIVSNRVVGVKEGELQEEMERRGTYWENTFVDIVGPENPLINSCCLESWQLYRINYTGFYTDGGYANRVQTFLLPAGGLVTSNDVRRYELVFPNLKNFIVQDRKQILGCGRGKLVPASCFKVKIRVSKDVDYRNVNPVSEVFVPDDKFLAVMRLYEVRNKVLSQLELSDILDLRAVGNQELNNNIQDWAKNLISSMTFLNEHQFIDHWLKQGGGGLYLNMEDTLDEVNLSFVNTFTFYGFVFRQQGCRRNFRFEFLSFCEKVKEKIKYVYIKQDAKVTLADLLSCLGILGRVEKLVLYNSDQVVMDIKSSEKAPLDDINVEIVFLRMSEENLEEENLDLVDDVD